VGAKQVEVSAHLLLDAEQVKVESKQLSTRRFSLEKVLGPSNSSFPIVASHKKGSSDFLANN
jgi:hypothetical protein